MSQELHDFYCDACELDFRAPFDGTGYEQAPCPKCQYVCISQALIEHDRKQLGQLIRSVWEVIWPRIDDPIGQPRSQRHSRWRNELVFAPFLILWFYVSGVFDGTWLLHGQHGLNNYRVILGALIICSLPFAWWQRHRGTCFPASAGEWLWLAEGVKLTYAEAAHFLTGLRQVVWLGEALIGIVFYLVPIFLVTVPARWKVFFGLSLIFKSTKFAVFRLAAFYFDYDQLFDSYETFMLVERAFSGLGLFIAGAFIIALFVDSRKSSDLPWSHWLGAATCVIWPAYRAMRVANFDWFTWLGL